MKRFILLLAFWSVFLSKTPAQSASGTEFWLAYMENLNLAFNDQPTFIIHIAAENDASGQISVPATGFSIDFSVLGGNQIDIQLPMAIWYSENSEQVEGKGIRITADNPIEVQATHYRLYFTEATNVLPSDELADEYLVTCYYQPNGLHPSSFVVVATEDNTPIEIIPTAFTLGLQGANVPFSITLDEGEIFQVQSLGELTGSRVRAINGQKIAVFSGAQQAIVGLNCFGSADNHLYEQSQPFNNWGDLYYFVPFSGQGGDLVRIVASENNTTIYFDCNEVSTLNAGDFYDAELGSATVINATQPISVTQFNESQDCNASGTGDPSMMQLLPTKNQGLYAAWEATQGLPGSSVSLTRHFTNVIMKTEDVGDIQWNGINISGQFSPFSFDETMSFAQLGVNSGSNKLTASSPFHAYHYGFGDFDAYTKTGSYQQVEDLEFVCLEIMAAGIFCVDSLLEFSTASNFDVLTYNWQTTDNQSSSLESPIFSFSAPGDYVVTLIVTTATGQNLTETYELNIIDCPNEPCDQDPMIELMVMDTCAGLENLFSYSSALGFVNVAWDFGDGSSISTAESPAHVFAAGNYTITFTGFDASNCAYTANIDLEIETCDPCGNPELTIFVEGELCAGEILTLTTNLEGANNFDFFHFWESTNGVFSAEPDAQFLADTPGDYLVTVTVEDFLNDCVYFGQITLEIANCEEPCNDLPPINLLGETEICVGEIGTLTYETTANLVDFTWTLNGAMDIITESIILEPNIEQTYFIEFFATDDNNCNYFTTISVEAVNCIDPCLDFSAGEIETNGLFCIDSNIVFSVAPFDAEVTYNWLYSNNQMASGEQFSTNFSAVGVQVIALNALSNDGCTDQITSEILIENCDFIDTCALVNGMVEITPITDLNLCLGDTIPLIFAANFTPTSVLWTFDDGRVFTQNMPPAVITMTESIGITLTLIDEQGCEFEDEFFTPNFNDCTDVCPIYLPNVFSPNQDNTNDLFQPISNCPPTTYDLKIFNRWGALVFQANNFEQAWDGIFKGKEAASGVYVWRMEYRSGGAQLTTDTGDVLLLR